MKKLDLRNKKKWEQFLTNNENKMLIVIIVTVFIYWIVSYAIPNFWIGILVYYLIYIVIGKIYNKLVKYFFATHCK